jgi:hypothetical protein
LEEQRELAYFKEVPLLQDYSKRDSHLAIIPRKLQEEVDYLVVIMANQVLEHLFFKIVHFPPISVQTVYLVLSQLKKSKKANLRNRKSKLSHKFRVINLNYFRIRTLKMLLEDKLLLKCKPRMQVLLHLLTILHLKVKA